MKDKFFNFVRARFKWVAGAVFFVLIAFIFRMGGDTAAEYVSLQAAAVGTLDVTIDADGSVSNHQAVDLNPKSSGTVVNIAVSEGQVVNAGQLLMSLDSYDAGLAVRNAELDVQSAQVKLDQLNEAAKATDVKTAENALSQVEQSLADVSTSYNQDKDDAELALSNAQEDLEQERVTAYSTAAEAFAELPSTLNTIDDVLNGHDYNSNQVNISYYGDQTGEQRALAQQADDLKEAYREAESIYNSALDLYNSVDVSSDSEQIVELMDGTYDTVEQFSVFLKDVDVFLLSLQDLYDSGDTSPSYLDDHISTVEATIATLNPQLTTLSDEVQTLLDLEQDVETAERDLLNLDVNYEADLSQAQLAVEAKELALEDLQDGPDANDVKAQEISVQKAQNALASAEKKYNDSFLSAPFDGVITDVAIDLGQTVSVATTAFTLVSTEKLVNVDLNEVDVTQVAIGQTGVATFDALPGVEVPVTLAFVSEVSNPNSSVVEYESHLALSQEVPDLKEGMSAHVSIQLNHVENTLLVPKTALTTVDGKTVVEVAMGNGLLEKTLYARSDLSLTTQEVTVGVQGMDQVEILSGLSEGEWVVLYSAAEQNSPMPTTRPSGAFGEGAIDNGPKNDSQP